MRSETLEQHEEYVMLRFEMLNVFVTVAGTAMLIWLYEKVTGKSWWANIRFPAVQPITPRYWRFSARVLGCLNSRKIAVLVRDDEPAMGERQIEISSELIPFDLRMPNSECDLMFDRHLRRFVKALHINEDWLDINNQ